MVILRTKLKSVCIKGGFKNTKRLGLRGLKRIERDIEYNLTGFPDSLVGKESACRAGDPGLIPGSGRSAEEGIGYPLWYSGLENSMDCRVHGVAKSRT